MLDELRANGRKFYDSFFCRSFPDKRRFGELNQWTIRTGGLNRESVIYSGGVGGDISFELELIQQFGCQIFLFDPSPVGKSTINALSDHPAMKNVHFFPIGLGGAAGELKCRVGGLDHGLEWIMAGEGKEGEGKAGEGENMKFETIPNLMRMNRHEKIDLFKLDIEGFEYEVVEDCLRSGVIIQQICLEYHHFLKEIPRSRTLNSLAALKKAGFKLFHKHMCDYSLFHE